MSLFRGFSTLSVHGACSKPGPWNSITDPIHCSSTFTFKDTREILDYLNSPDQRDEYSRYSHPNQRSVEEKLAALDGSEQSLLFSSGMAAVTLLFLSRLKQGDHIIFFDETYHRTREFCNDWLTRYGIRITSVKTGDFTALEHAITPRTKMFFTELPTNPHLSVISIPRMADLGKKHQIEVVVDSTLATPFNCRPLELGADFVVHSATKYLAGHNDVLAGVLSGKKDLLKDTGHFRGLTGAVCGPHASYLLQRGLKTFALRMEQHNRNGQKIAEFLSGHPRVKHVWYPGLQEHRDHQTATHQMKGFGGLVTFLTDGDGETAGNVIDRLRIPKIGPSLGGVESLVEQPAVMSYYHLSPGDREEKGIPDQMIRLSAGIECTEDLIDDLNQALSSKTGV